MNSRRSAPLAAALAALVALSGCAADNTLSSLDSTLDTAPPGAPTNIRGEMRGTISVLAWDESTDADVVGYDVFLYSPDPARESAYIRVNASPITAAEYVASEGAIDAWYRVKAVDLSGNRSTTSGAAWVAGTVPIGNGTETGTDEAPIAR